MKHPMRSTLVAAILAAFAMSAHAADGPTVTISGFGTAALTMSDTDDAQFVRPNQVAGAGESVRTGVDSNFGVQATAKINDSLSFTGQGLVRKIARDHYGAELAWAFAKYKINDDFAVRAGRVGAPVYMISDFRSVGYANTMLRPPQEVYGQVNVDTLDGVDVVYQHSFGDTSVTAQLGFGRTKVNLASGANVKYSPVTALHLVAEHGPFTVRFGHVVADFSVYDSAAFTGLYATLNRVGQTKAVNDFRITDAKGSFTSLGFTMDYNNILVQSEYAVRKTDTLVVHDTTSYYAMLGYRFGKFTPYYMYANAKQDDARTYAGLPNVPALAPLAAALNGIVKAPLQSTNAVGVRWDFYKSAALKVQIDRVTPRDGVGMFVNAKPGFQGPVTVGAVALDFVF